MDMLWTLFLLAAAMWILQMLFGMWQYRRFNARIKALRRDGRVAIGRARGRFASGVILLLCIDRDCNIIKAEKMEGRSVLASFHPFHKFDGKNLLTLDEGICKEEKLNSQVTKAALSAKQDYLNYQELQKERVATSA